MGSDFIADAAAAASNPAGPRGLQDLAGQVDRGGKTPAQTNGDFIAQAAVDAGSYTDNTARQWYTGANMEGVSNGWDTGFQATAMKQFDEQQAAAQEAQDSRVFYDWFSRDDATGVVTWDDEKRGLQVGDVYNQGKKVGNVFSDFDEKTANVMMAEFTLDRKTKAKIFADRDRDTWLASEVRGVLDENTTLAKNVESSMEFEENVEDRQEDVSVVKTVLGGAVGGAATFGTAGAALGAPTGLGAVVTGIGGAIVGAATGGASAYLNRDQLTEQVARAQEVTALARKQYGGLEGASTALREYSGVGMRMIAPLSNLNQGLADDVRGDGESRFYAIDEDGNRKVGTARRALDIAATLGDSVLQFSNPIGAAAYLGTTAGHVAGSAAFMAQTGAGWNDRIGGFDDYEGGKEWGAALGNLGIDVVQMGVAGAMVKAGAASRAAFGVTEKTFVGRTMDKLTPWRDPAVRTESINGMRFQVSRETGEVLGKSRIPDVAVIAPSEAIRYVNTAWRARSRAALGEKPGYDDFYRAAQEVAGGHRFGQAVVNGWAEGVEEGVQAVLEPVSFSADVNPGQVVESVLYGAASGMGMGLGSLAKQASTDQVLSSRARALESRRNGVEYSNDEWKARWKELDADQKKRLAIASPAEADEIRNTMRAMQEKAMWDRTGTSPIAPLALGDLRESMFARDLVSANPNRDNVLVLAGMSADRIVATDADGNTFVDADALPAHAGASSIYQTLVNITNHQLALGTVGEDIERQTEQLNAELASADADRATEIQAQLVELTEEADLNDRTLRMGEAIRKMLAAEYETYRQATDVVTAEASIDRFNEIIARAFAADLDIAGQPVAGLDAEAARRAVEIMVTRHPDIAGDSFMLVMPQASKALSRANAHGQMQVHQSTLLAPGADHDGDTEVSVNFARLPQASLDALRQGGQYIDRAEGTPTLTVDPPDGEKYFIAKLTEGLNAARVTALWSNAEFAVGRLVSELHARYAPHFGDTATTRILEAFRTDLADGNPDARLNLANALAADPAAFRAAAAANGNTPEMPWLMQRITLAWEQFLTSSAALSHDLEFTPKDVERDLTEDKAYLRALAQREASSDGQTMYLITEGLAPVRDAQKLHYSVYRAAVSVAPGDLQSETFQRFVQLYAELGSGMGRSEMDRVRGRNAVERRVAGWLEGILEEARKDGSLGADAPNALALLANMQVADVRIVDGQAEVYEGDISLLQLLLRRSVDIERQQNRRVIEQDEDLQRKLRRLERLASRDATEDNRSTTAQLAFKEVFGGHQLHELLDDSAKYLGPHLTLNQLVADLANRTEESRKQQLYRWRRKAPYVMHEHIGNPPYTAAEAASGDLSSYKVVVDTIAAAVQTKPRELRESAARTREQFKLGINNLQSMVAEFRKANLADLKDTDDLTVLRALLSSNMEVARWIADLIPDAAKVGAFAFVDGRPVAARWVEEMLVMPADKAAVTYAVQSKLAEWRGLTRGEVDNAARSYHKIKSRFLQTLAQLAAQPDGIELNRFIMAAESAPSVEALEEQINSTPAWRGDRAELLLFADDVAAYEADINDVWTANTPGTLQREAISNFADRTTSLSRAMAEHAVQMTAERTLLKAILAYDDDPANDRDRASLYHELLGKTIANRGWMSDHHGPAVRDRFTEKVQDGVIRMHDKGTADPAIAPFGEALVTTDEFGVKQSVFQTADALTMYDVEDILTNPTKLAEGPVRVGLPDGSSLIVDFTTVRGAAIALADPALNAFAKQVLFPTARDVNSVGSLSTYFNVSGTGLKTMLEEADFSDLFGAKGDRPSLAKAHKYISMIEAAVRREAIDGTEEEQARAYFPIQATINEFVIAYTHRPGYEGRNKKQIRDQLIVDVADALQRIELLNRKGPEVLDQMRSILTEVLRARFTRNNKELASKLQSQGDQAVEDAAVLEAYSDILVREIARLDTVIENALAAGDTDQATALGERQAALQAKMEERLDSMELLKSDDLVTAAINMYTLSGDPVADTDRKGAILRLLGSGNRVNKFQGPYHLINRLNTVLANDQYALSDPKAFSPEEWSELGLWAASVFLAEVSSRSGSGIKLTPLVLGEKGEKLRRYYDPTWSYLVDGLFRPEVLAAANRMAVQAGFNHDYTDSDVAKTLESGLFNEKKLGAWTELVVPASIKAQMVLDSASVGLAIPVGGDLPKEAAAYVGSGRRTFAQSDKEGRTLATMLTTRIVSEEWTTEDFFKLNNHFASRVVVRDAAGTELDVLPQVGAAWLGEATVTASPYRIISRDRLDKALADAREAGTITGDVQIEVTYFDIDTMPHSREWANNVYFEGVGREEDTGTTPGLVAEMFFAPGAISKLAQQNPLNMATKGGAGYRATPVTELSEALATEGYHSVAAVLRSKADTMMRKAYDVGTPVAGDANSLYKLMTQRHVVVGTNAAGEKEVWWAGKAIEWQSLNAGQPITAPDFPLDGARLVPLTDSQAQTLLGEPGNKGLPGVSTLPQLNLADLDIFPELTAEYLAARGLTRLGEEATMRQSAFAGRLPLMNIAWSGDKDSGLNTRYEAAIEVFKGQQLETYNRRMEAKGLNISNINDVNARKLHALLGVEGLTSMFAKLGVPMTELRDMRGLAITDHLSAKLLELTAMKPSSIVWQHVHGASSDPARGVLSEVTLKSTNGFEGAPAATWPTYEDIVVLDLDSFVGNERRNYVLAYDLALEALRAYTRRGVTVVLAGDQKLRSDLAEHLAQGSEGYARMAESPHFFAPANPDTYGNLSELALESTLTSTKVFSGTSLILTHNSDRYSTYGSSENATFWDLRPGQPVWRGESVTLIPTQLGTEWGRPVKGLGPNDQEAGVRARLVELLKSPEGRAHIVSLGGDPVDVPVYRNVNGVEEFGIRSIEDAMDHLLGVLESGKFPLGRETIGDELMLGDLIPTVRSDGAILLTRVGFQLPAEHELREQLLTPVNAADPAKNPGKIAVAKADLQEAWTTKPPAQIEAIDPDPLAGLSVRVKYDLSRYGKGVTEGDGWKTVRSPMPNDLAGPLEDMGVNGLRVNSFSSQKSPESKQAIGGKIDNFGWAFALSGIDFRRDLVEFVTGRTDSTTFEQDWNNVRTFLDRWASIDHGYEASQIAGWLSEGSFAAIVGPQINGLAEELGLPALGVFNEDNRFNKPTANQRLGQILLASLMSPRLGVDNVIGTQGLLHLDRLDAGGQVQLLPDIVTRALNDFDHPELREMLFDRVNAALPRRADGSRPYILDRDWTFRIEMQHPLTGVTEYVPGSLQVSLEYPADENPVNYAQAGARSMRQGASQHVAFVGYETLGMRTAVERASRIEQQLFSTEGLEDFEEDGGFWRMLRNTPGVAGYNAWAVPTRLQRLEFQEAAAKKDSYLKPVDKAEWTEQKQQAAAKLQDAILTELFGDLAESYRVEVDYLVRQFAGLPDHRENQPEYVGKVSPDVYIQVASLILDNVREHMIPTYGGVVPVPDHALMASVFEANLGRKDAWAPRTNTGRKMNLAKGWNEWVSTTYAHVMRSEELFDATFMQDTNGFMHTWQSANADAGVTHVSLDQLRAQKLFDVETNRFLANLDPSEEARLTQPVIFETMRATLDQLVGDEESFTREAARTTPDSELAKRLERHIQWRAGKKMPKQEKQTLHSLRDEGTFYLHSMRDTHNLMHNVVNLSVGMRLLNPALWTSAIVEVYLRNKFESITNLATGTSTSVVGRAVSKAQEKAGLVPVYSVEQLKKLDKLAESMGSDDKFLSVVYDEMTYKNLVEAGRGRVGRGLESFAAFSARATSDPRFGMRAKQEAMRYLEAAFEYMRVTDNVVPFDVAIREMNLDSLWLEKNFRTDRFSPHRAGLNRLAQTRSIKASVPSKLIMGGIDKMAASDRTGVNLAGHLLKIPLLFTRFNSNALVTMMGLGGLDQMTAMFLDQRQPLLKSMMRGEDRGDQRYDMTDVIEGADLFRPFVKGALTHTGLLALGMAAGGLGLSGEDEETKRRRRLATYLGTPYYYDPRAVQNDFRYADAIFTDGLPGVFESLLRVGDEEITDQDMKHAVQPHWIFRQFLSPIVGVERFLSTGDVRQIGWGFSDAFAVMPNSIKRVWDEANVTAEALKQSAREVDGKVVNDVEGQALEQKLIISIAGVYERALFENSFVNAVRNGFDDYDRNAWEIPAMENGVIQRDPLTGAPVPTQALEQTIDPRTGEATTSYAERSPVDAYLHQYAENSLTAAVMLSLFTGQIGMDSTYFRQNMVPSQKTLTMPEKGQAYDEAVLLSALRGKIASQGATESFANLSQYEAEQMVWATKPDGAFWSAEDVAAKARALVDNRQLAGLTLLDEAGAEVLSKDGARGVLTSLAKGMVQLGDPSLAGIHITVPMRQQIQDEWTDELVNEGLAMGLTERVAQIRARRIWYGNTFEDPNAKGLRDLVWSDEIPWTGKATYNQLNTTFVMGPDGRPWATPFERQNLLQALGIPLPSTPMRNGEGISRDGRGNAVDDVYGINTGLMGLQRVEDQGKLTPPKDEPKAFSEPRTKSDESDGGSGSGWVDFGNSGWKNYKKRGYTPYKRRSYSSGGSTGYPNFTRMYGLPSVKTPYANDIPFINTSNPILRRANVRRERVWSERGRLNQWQ